MYFIHWDSLNSKGRPNVTQRCRWFANASISMQVAMLPWRYVVEWAPQTRYMLRRNTASIMKGLVLGLDSNTCFEPF